MCSPRLHPGPGPRPPGASGPVQGPGDFCVCEWLTCRVGFPFVLGIGAHAPHRVRVYNYTCLHAMITNVYGTVLATTS